MQTVLPRGLQRQRRSSYTAPNASPTSRTKNVLNTHQSAAVTEVLSAEPRPILLHGVTGSGKTRVYIALAKRKLAQGLSTILLVPEIALTSQLVQEFTKHFPDIILTHSQQSEAERHLAWLEALRSKTPRIIIGPRSALFLPVAKLGLIVVDECHEPSYKQAQSPRYSALRVAETLGSHHAAHVIFGSATPSITDYYRAARSPRAHSIITLPEPARHDAKPPSISVIDMTKRANFCEHPLFSDTLLSAVRETLNDGKQVLFFHNRRGSASTTRCEHCGWQAGCARCFIPLTLHADAHQLICHICGSKHPVPTGCPECHRADIIHAGIGTKRLEAELRRLFPAAAIARFDGDSTTTQGVDARYPELLDGSIQIIIGTQVVAKGLDLPHLRAVSVVQADAGLHLPDYSAAERTFQLLSQVIGRVGRSRHTTRVVLQSYQPTHPSIVDALSQNYTDFYERALRQRKKMHFPPFCHLLLLVCTYRTEATAVRNSSHLAEILRKNHPRISVLGPTPAFYERQRDSYRWQLVVKAAVRDDLIAALADLPPKNWQYELDPVSLL